MTPKNDKINWTKVYLWIKSGIESCRFNMGMPMPESYIAKETGVSRTSVREALRVLANEGYVKIVPFKGAFVSDISIEDVRDIFEIRKLIEPYAVISAVGRIPDAEIKRLEAWIDASPEKLEKEKSAVFSCALRLEGEFYSAIVAYTPNRRIGEILSECYSKLKLFADLSEQAFADIGSIVKSNAEIAKCIRRRDCARLKQCVYIHIVECEEAVMKGYFMR